MALLYAENFERFTTVVGSTVTSVGGTVAISTGRLRLSGTGTSTGNVSINVAQSDTYIVNLRFEPTVRFHPSSTTSGVVFALLDVNSTQIALYTAVDGMWRLAVGSTVVATIPGLQLWRVYDIECKVFLNNATGTLELRIDGQVVASLSNIDTQATANAYATRLYLAAGSTGGSPDVLNYYHHIIVMNGTGTELNDFLGPVEMPEIVPTASGSYSDFVANTGTDFQAVDDTNPDGDTTYIAGTLADKSTFICSDLPAGVTDIHGVVFWNYARRDDGVTRGIKNLMRNGTDELTAGEYFVGSSYAYGMLVQTLSPFTGAAWTPAEFNATELGVEGTT